VFYKLMMRTRYFLRSFKEDVIAAITAVILTTLAFIFIPSISLPLSVLIIFFSLIAVIYSRLKDKDFYFIPFAGRKDKDEWIGSGTLEYVRTHKCFSITNADPGYVHSKCLTWSNYRIEFEFKIVSRCLGVIVRAVSLSNYVMLQINPNGIRPHLRINGGWRVWEPPHVGLAFGGALSLDGWYRCVISCESESLNIKLFDSDTKIFDREWKIPPGHLIFQFGREEEGVTPVAIPFPINLEYGSFGFRNSRGEKASIKNVLVEKI